MSREIVREHGVMLLLGSMRAEERVAAFLLNLTQRLHARGFSRSELVLRMTREEIGDEKARRETIANAVDAIMKEKGVGYDDAWILAKKDPALKPVWDAMRTEG